MRSRTNFPGQRLRRIGKCATAQAQALGRDADETKRILSNSPVAQTALLTQICKPLAVIAPNALSVSKLVQSQGIELVSGRADAHDMPADDARNEEAAADSNSQAHSTERRRVGRNPPRPRRCDTAPNSKLAGSQTVKRFRNFGSSGAHSIQRVEASAYFAQPRHHQSRLPGAVSLLPDRGEPFAPSGFQTCCAGIRLLHVQVGSSCQIIN